MAIISSTTPTNLRKNLFDSLTHVTEEDEQLLITMKSGKNAVLMSEDHWNHMREQADLERWDTDENILNAMNELDNGGGITFNSLKELKKEIKKFQKEHRNSRKTI
jgi:antitoxin YefM